MKNTTSEMKNTLQGINTGCMKQGSNQQFGTKSSRKHSIKATTTTKKEFKKKTEDSLLQHYIKHKNIHIVGYQK